MTYEGELIVLSFYEKEEDWKKKNRQDDWEQHCLYLPCSFYSLDNYLDTCLVSSLCLFVTDIADRVILLCNKGHSGHIQRHF